MKIVLNLTKNETPMFDVLLSEYIDMVKRDDKVLKLAKKIKRQLSQRRHKLELEKIDDGIL